MPAETLLNEGGAGAVLELLYEPLAAGEDLAVLAGEAGESLAGDRDSGGGGGGGSFVARGVGAAAFQIANVVGVVHHGSVAPGVPTRPVVEGLALAREQPDDSGVSPPLPPAMMMRSEPTPGGKV